MFFVLVMIFKILIIEHKHSAHDDHMDHRRLLANQEEKGNWQEQFALVTKIYCRYMGGGNNDIENSNKLLHFLLFAFHRHKVKKYSAKMQVMREDILVGSLKKEKWDLYKMTPPFCMEVRDMGFGCAR